MRVIIRLCALVLLLPLRAIAACSCPGGGRCLCIGVGTSFSLWEISNRIIIFLSGSILAIAVTMFVVGSAMIMVSGAREDYKEKGKNLLYGAIISVVVVLGAYALLRTVSCFLSTGGCTI